MPRPAYFSRARRCSAFAKLKAGHGIAVLLHILEHLFFRVVPADKDHVKLVEFRFLLLIPSNQPWGELPARTTPRCREVDGQVFLGFEGRRVESLQLAPVPEHELSSESIDDLVRWRSRSRAGNCSGWGFVCCWGCCRACRRDRFEPSPNRFRPYKNIRIRRRECQRRAHCIHNHSSGSIDLTG